MKSNDNSCSFTLKVFTIHLLSDHSLHKIRFVIKLKNSKIGYCDDNVWLALGDVEFLQSAKTIK